MAKILSYREFQELALKNYNNGGDVIVECWDEQSFQVHRQEFGPMTEEKARALFRLYKSNESEVM